jgi:hypothetical protein
MAMECGNCTYLLNIRASLKLGTSRQALLGREVSLKDMSAKSEWTNKRARGQFLGRELYM